MKNSLKQGLADTALILIDIQKGFQKPEFWGARNNPDFERIAPKLLGWVREQGGLSVHVKHLSLNPSSPLAPGHSGSDFQDGFEPLRGEKVIYKSVNSAFIGTDLEPYLRRQGVRRIILAGIATDHCVSTTARMGANLGFEVTVVADATYTFDRKTAGGAVVPAQTVYEANLASLHGEFAEVMSFSHLIETMN